MRYTLTVTAILWVATSASSFEVDLELQEVEQLRGNYLISDLTVGTPARIKFACEENGRLFVFDSEAVNSRGDFIATLKPNGHFSLRYSPLDYKGDPATELYRSERPIMFNPCEFMRGGGYSGNLLVVDDIDGYTIYSEWGRSVLERFPLKE